MREQFLATGAIHPFIASIFAMIFLLGAFMVYLGISGGLSNKGDRLLCTLLGGLAAFVGAVPLTDWMLWGPQ